MIIIYTLINGSQKVKNSNSKYFIDYISNYLNDYVIFDLKHNNYKDIFNCIKNSNIIVLVFPLYVDSPNSLTLNFLDYIYDNNINLNNKKLYVVINCGFKEGKHNITALNIIKNWCIKVNITYQGSILIGAGEIVGKKSYKFISYSALNKLKKFSNCIKNNKKSNDIITSIDLINSKLYCVLANISWNKKCKKNKLSKEEIKK